ncbi:MAG: nuclear transport factor 2 family protein [Planctomycetota bacterium]
MSPSVSRLAAGLVSLLLGLAPDALAQEKKAAPAGTRAVAEAYIDSLFLERDLDRIAMLTADETLFIDPTADLWGGPIMSGVRGKENVIAVMRRANPERLAYRLERSFSTGEYAFFYGKLDWKTYGQPVAEGIPLATLLRIQNDRVVERHDHGDYEHHLLGVPKLPKEEQQRRQDLARRYLQAYSETRLKDMAALLTEDAIFQDPTAAAIGGGQTYRGAKAIHAALEQAFTHVKGFEITTTAEFFSNNHAVFIGDCRFEIPGELYGVDVPKIDFEQALIVVLKMEGDRIVDHRDYSDYSAYRERIEKARGDQ